MLKRIILSNFLSFSEKTVFDFTPTDYRILTAANVSSTNVLKGGLLIGPNASGKTNALKAIRFLLELLKDENTNCGQYMCLWSGKSFFETVYQFDISGTIVDYIVRYYASTGSLEESLAIDGREIMIRKGTSGSFSLGEQVIKNDDLEQSELLLRTVLDDSYFVQGNQILRELTAFLANSVYLSNGGLSAYAERDIERFVASKGLDRANRCLRDFGFDLSLEYMSSMSADICSGSSNKRLVVYKRKASSVLLPLNMASQGELVFTCMLLNMIDVIEKPGMIIIDDFGNGIHNKLVERVISFFMNNANASQMITSSHRTNLISCSVFRPDQIYLVTFEGVSGSNTRRLSDYKPRESQNMEKMYLSGMFVGLP